MGFAELIVLSIGLAMDAFAVSVCKGLDMPRLHVRLALIIALAFGGFQALMPVIGWMLGSQFAWVVMPAGHWIAFGLLAFVGGKMIWDALHESGTGGEGAEVPSVVSESPPAAEEESSAAEEALDVHELFMLAIATSIDALAVGVTFAFLQVDIAGAVTCIGVITFALSFAGVAIGHQFGKRWEKPSTIAGGAVLILIGVKTLVEHLIS